jgi:hypothetical protein
MYSLSSWTSIWSEPIIALLQIDHIQSPALGINDRAGSLIALDSLRSIEELKKFVEIEAPLVLKMRIVPSPQI